MIPGDLSARLRMLAEASFFDSEPPIQGTARIRELQARLPELVPGQRFTATLQDRLPDGTFRAIVADRSYTLALNHAAKAGDTLELIVTQSNPRAVLAQLANPAAMANAPAAANASLSTTGRLISFLLTGQPTPQPTALAVGKPLLDAPPATNGALLAPALRQALSQSGLFYEAHQSQWVAGKRELATLLHEPQGQQAVARGALAPSGAGMPPPAGASPGAPAPTANSAPSPPGTAGPAPAAAGPPAQALAQAAPPPAPAATPGAAAARADLAGATPGMPEDAAEEGLRPQGAAQTAAAQRLPLVPERLMPVVHQQLDALATQNYVWHGQVWPGQNVEWEIEDPERDARGAGDETGAEWNTTLRLTLPRLGGVEARLHLTAAGIALRLVADDEAAVTALQAAQVRLDEALAAADVPLTGFFAERRDASG